MHKTLRRVATPLAGFAFVAGAVALPAAPAAAHADLTPSTTVAGEYAVLTFSIGHGCDGSPTTDVAIDIPKGVDVVTPTVNVGWTINKQTEPLPDAESSGGEHAERVTRVTYSAQTPLPDGYRDTFELSVPLPDKPGETLTFPTVQSCKKGEVAWSQVPKDGQDVDDLDTPAPSMELTASESSTSDGSDATNASGTTDASAEAADDGSDGNGLAWGGLIVGVIGLAVGGTALVRTRS